MKLDLKSMTIGILIGSLGITTAFAASGIKSASYSKAKVFFYDKQVPLSDSLVSIIKDGETNAKLYMPVRELLEYMQFNVNYDSSDGNIYLTMNGNNGQNNNPQSTTVPSDISVDEADKTALDIMQRTGNWAYIEKYLPHMSNEGIETVVRLYNSKHQNPNEHKKASNYTH